MTGVRPYGDIEKTDKTTTPAKPDGKIVPIEELRCDTPLSLIHIVNQCIDQDKDNRFPSAKRLLKALQDFDNKRDGLYWFRMHWTRGVQRKVRRVGIFAGFSGIVWVIISYLQSPLSHVEKVAPPPSGPRLELVNEFQVPESFRKYQLMKPCQWFPDVQRELAFFSESEAAIFTTNGEELMRFGASSIKFQNHGDGIMVQDINGDGLDELFISGGFERTLEARVYNQSAFELKKFQVDGSYNPNANSAINSYNSFLTVHSWEDIDGDGQSDFLAVIRTGHLLRPRSLICFDGQSEQIKWRFDTGAEITQVLTHDLDSDGIKEILFACASVANGAVGLDGRKDVYSIVGALSPGGEELWVKTTGGPMTNPWIDLLDNGHILISLKSEQDPLALNRSANYKILDLNSQTIENASNNTLPQNAILVIDTKGNTQDQLFIGESVSACNPVNSSEEKQNIIVHAGDGHVLILNQTLEKVLHHFKFKQSNALSTQIDVQMVGVNDMVGDSNSELIFLIAEGVTHSKNWTSDPSKPPTQKTFFDHRIQLFDAQLTPIIGHSFLEGEESKKGYRTTLMDADGDGVSEILTLKNGEVKIYRAILE